MHLNGGVSGVLTMFVSLGNPARGSTGRGHTYIPNRLLVKVVAKVYYLVSGLAEDTYIPSSGVNQSYIPTPVKTSILGHARTTRTDGADDDAPDGKYTTGSRACRRIRS